MTYQENHEEKYKRHSSSQAISLAMEGRWKEAVEVNKSLIKRTPNDADAYNRLGKAYMEIGQYKDCLLYTSPSPRDRTRSRMPSSA